MKFLRLSTLLLTGCASSLALAHAQTTGGPAEQKPVTFPTNGPDLPPDITDAGGLNVPNLGMHDLKRTAEQNNGFLPSSAILLQPGTIAPTSPAPSGWVLTLNNLYLPDNVEPGMNQGALLNKYSLPDDSTYPLDMWFSNSDPSGSLDRTALDESGDPIHFNLHWPQDTPEGFWLTDQGIDPASPLDDLMESIEEIKATGAFIAALRAKDILLGTNASLELGSKGYLGFELLNYKGRKDNRTLNATTRNIVIDQIWYGDEIRSSHNMVRVPVHGDYTITWRLRGLGDPGPNREFAFPIDEFSAIPMKQAANGLFWNRNLWVWKWFDAVEAKPGRKRKYSLENLFELHTGTPEDELGNPVPTYADALPGDPRYWLHLNRKMNMGSMVGGFGEVTDISRWEALDLDLDGQIGGYLVDGTDTGLPFDLTTNASAQFNSYGNSEYAVPVLDWSQGPYHLPYFGYDSSFTTIRKGEGIDLTIRYGQGQSQAGLYIWGWREHPPRINWLETYSDGQMLPSGAPKDWRFGHKWDEVGAMGLDAIGDLAPEKIIYNAVEDFLASAQDQAAIDVFAAATDGLEQTVRDKRFLPETPGVVGFPEATSDVNLFYGNLDLWSDRSSISAAGKRTFREGDKIRVTVYNDDNVTRYFRVVDFGTTDYQYVGTDMGLLDWKPVFGFPQIAAAAWAGLFTQQGFGKSFWAGTELEGEGNPFYVDPTEDNPAGFWPAGERDLKFDFTNLSGYSGPGFHFFQDGAFSVWGNNLLAGKKLGAEGIWDYSYGAPVPAKTVVTFEVEMPRSAALNNGAMYMFDPQFHFTSIGTNHPESELIPEGLAD